MNKAKEYRYRFVIYIGFILLGVVATVQGRAQNPTQGNVFNVLDSLRQMGDTALYIRNLNPYMTLHVDSSMVYNFEINKNPANYFWTLKNSPLGLRINKDNGVLTFRADKSYFLSGKLKYDFPYKVTVGVQNLNDPRDRMDTTFSILFFTTDIVPSRLKPSVNNTLFIDEGDTINFRIECEEGSFPVESISFFSSVPIRNYTIVKKCDDDFTWSPPFDFIKETDSGKQKLVTLSFVGMNKFFVKDTATVKLYVKDAVNYPVMLNEYQRTVRSVTTYVLQLKYAFVQLDHKVKHTSGTRTTFDLTSAGSALGGTVFSSSGSPSAQNTGKILPSAGVALVPVKESVSPVKTAEQNSASLIRSSIKRLEYQMHENALVGERDADITRKISKLKDEMKQIQIQLIEVPIDDNTNMTEEQLNEYFNSKKVNKKYKLKRRK